MLSESIRKHGLAVAAGIGLLLLGSAPPLRAGDLDKSVTMTFSGPVQIPGKILPAGTYVFRRWDVSGNPNAMMVFDANDQKPIGLTMYYPASYELDAAPQWGSGGGDARPGLEVRLNPERIRNTPQKLEEWSYPGDPVNYKLVYPNR